MPKRLQRPVYPVHNPMKLPTSTTICPDVESTMDASTMATTHTAADFGIGMRDKVTR
ncbi:hypothetical protein OVA24_11920 [Luteolibacter sp. SL250]|uniref:hypothetical protein n=1 Tax=Luteolibacter sp. SL250 TaxID=2995170 RepID=UPI00227095C8|nr:hypothetical protein [Luteolibacter sp. SL250]WAC17944.1 hypothetical protein OVA24_11920 [Luteolibacter sp. SL250]